MSIRSASACAASGLAPFDFADLDRTSLLRVLGIATERLAALLLAGSEGVWMKQGDELGLRKAAGFVAPEGSWRWITEQVSSRYSLPEARFQLTPFVLASASSPENGGRR